MARFQAFSEWRVIRPELPGRDQGVGQLPIWPCISRYRRENGRKPRVGRVSPLLSEAPFVGQAINALVSADCF